ncbi:hypothetical protein P43SY_008496 [Pythium insidiosum]|uniref:subtilisin n=1 Tax=Pythium insidiosum TaxID=114742 RepID=A0AAD5M9K9_PYTIN|nr:hypothetical protein P43SY_008496 [Pythium insidiosum]
MYMRLWVLTAAVLVAALGQADAVESANQVWLVRLHPPVRVPAEPDASLELELLSRAQRRESVHRRCRAAVRESQRSLLEYLASTPWQQAQNGSEDTTATLEITPLWIQNVVIVAAPRELDGVDSFFTSALRWFPGVIDIHKDELAPWKLLPVSQFVGDTQHIDSNVSEASPQRNVRLLRAPKLWSVGIRGDGITIASIDSGVRYTHDALYGSFRGRRSHGVVHEAARDRHVSFDYSFWFPPGTDLNKETPDTADPVGHGTHTIGTALGAGGIGIAPGATWIAARAFDLHGAVTQSDFLLATQWVICPTKVDGSGKNCSLGADVVTGSFGVDRHDADTLKAWSWLTHVLQVWRQAGTTAVFAAGNTNGFLCGSVFYPASREESVAVGALVGGSTLWGASGKGPSVEDVEGGSRTILKPDFVAPGVAIRSALSTADNAFTRLTGTSMATPHVAGAVALLLSAQHKGRHATADVLGALRNTTKRELSKPFLVPSQCGGTSYKQYPNNIYGFGLPDVCSAAHELGVACGGRGLTNEQDELAIE